MTIKFWLQDKLDKVKGAYCRARYGYDSHAVWDTSYWFIRIMPKILEDIKKEHTGIPFQVVEEYCNSKGLDVNKGDYDIDEVDEYWMEIIDYMISCFKSADEFNDGIINCYQEQYDKMWEDFDKEYGHLGCNIPQRQEDKEKGLYRAYCPWDKEVGRKDWQDLCKAYSAESRRIDDIRVKKAEEGLKLFVKYFWSLGD